MKFYKSFLFLFVLNILLILPVWFFLNLRFLIPTAFACLLLDIFLLFFIGFYLRKKLVLSSFSPEDAYGIHKLFENLKTYYELKNIFLFKVREINSAFFYFSALNKNYIVLSEDILESFSQEDKKYLLSYPFQKARSGDLLFLTVLSGFLFLAQKFLYFLNYPLSFFKKKAVAQNSLAFILKILSLMTRRIFYDRDKKLLPHGEGQGKQALLLWRLNSFTRLNPSSRPDFFAPLFLVNPLKEDSSLHPLIKDRIKALVGTYPP